MAADRSPLRLVSGQAPAAGSEPASDDVPAFGTASLDAALRVVGSDRGAIVRRAHGAAASASVEVAASNLSPEEEAACRELARRMWQRPRHAGPLPSRLGGSTLVAQPLELPAADFKLPDYIFIAVIRGGAGKVDTDRLTAFRAVSVLLAAAVFNAATAEQALRLVDGHRWRTARTVVLDEILKRLAGAADLESGCKRLVLDLVAEVPDVIRASVWLLDARGTELRRRAAAGDGAESPSVLPLHGGFAVDAVITTGVTQQIEFSSPRARTASAKLARRLKLSSLLQVPLSSRGAVLGVLMLAGCTRCVLSSEERNVVELIGAQLGARIDVERSLEASAFERERLRALVETLPMAIVLYDAAGKVSLWNTAVESLLGSVPVNLDDGARASLPLLATPDGRPLSPEESPVLRAAREGRSTEVQELAVRRPSAGFDTPVLVTAAPVRDQQGRLDGVIAVYQDITRLREVDRLKDDFINSVSHELRTPTTTVRGGALTLLKRGDQLEASVRRQLLQDMADEAERLYHLVEDLLSLSRAQAGLRLQPEPLILARFVNKVILDLGGRVGNHALTVEVPNDLPLVEADPTYLEQVLRNLLENAVKFSPKGRRIELTAAAHEQEIVFSVLDRGSGIPAADMDRVFEPFYRTDEAVRTGQQGAGLGLAVSRRVIEVMGGRIWAERRGGGGTAFRFTLPALSEEDE